MWGFWDVEEFGFDVLDDRMLLRSFLVEKDKRIFIRNFLKILGKWGRERKIVFKILFLVVVSKDFLVFFLGEFYFGFELV